MDGIPPPPPHTHDDGENKIDLKFNTSTASVKSAPQTKNSRSIDKTSTAVSYG